MTPLGSNRQYRVKMIWLEKGGVWGRVFRKMDKKNIEEGGLTVKVNNQYTDDLIRKQGIFRKGEWGTYKKEDKG